MYAIVFAESGQALERGVPFSLGFSIAIADSRKTCPCAPTRVQRCCPYPQAALRPALAHPFTLFLETVEPVVVEAEGSETFFLMWQQLLFREADAAWICFFPGSTHTEAFAHEAGRTGIRILCWILKLLDSEAAEEIRPCLALEEFTLLSGRQTSMKAGEAWNIRILLGRNVQPDKGVAPKEPALLAYCLSVCALRPAAPPAPRPRRGDQISAEEVNGECAPDTGLRQSPRQSRSPPERVYTLRTKGERNRQPRRTHTHSVTPRSSPRAQRVPCSPFSVRLGGSPRRADTSTNSVALLCFPGRSGSPSRVPVVLQRLAVWSPRARPPRTPPPRLPAGAARSSRADNPSTFQICKTVFEKTVSWEGLRKQVWSDARFLSASRSLKSLEESPRGASMSHVWVIIMHLVGQHLPYCWGERTQITMSSLPDLHDVDVTNYAAMLYLETKVSRGLGTAQPQFLKEIGIIQPPRPSLSTKGQIQTIANQGRKGVQEQRKNDSGSSNNRELCRGSPLVPRSVNMRTMIPGIVFHRGLEGKMQAGRSECSSQVFPRRPPPGCLPAGSAAPLPWALCSLPPVRCTAIRYSSNQNAQA
ncbi:PREDICTED: uncharacterized protein LOC103074577 [Lipotes vexillifer]|uniref:Uncharacterized protein LOC103074577 n=1 Tax=Lipotes vexillifer TaxID=118797 RepID=A0A340YB95_LIPVE|nr:PREDICTED: uncharacterized protein LOC103074577 [Lipotes vexillifer]